MDSTILPVELNVASTVTGPQTQSLYKVCHRLVDGRAARGKASELAGLVVLLILAK